MAVFFLLLIFYFPELRKLEDFFIYFATVLLSLHFWYGAVFFIKTLGPTRHLREFSLDLSIFALKLVSIYFILVMPIWFLLNAILMCFGVLKYYLALRKKCDEKTRKFIMGKVPTELFAVLSFFMLGLLTWKIDLDLFRKIISILVFGIQLPFLHWTFFKKKLYKI